MHFRSQLLDISVAWLTCFNTLVLPWFPPHEIAVTLLQMNMHLVNRQLATFISKG